MGLALFGGKVTTNPGAADYITLQGTDFGGGGATAGYWACSFNDMLSGMVTLFYVLLVNNWYEHTRRHSTPIDSQIAAVRTGRAFSTAA
jgi:hypothetical protein